MNNVLKYNDDECEYIDGRKLFYNIKDRIFSDDVHFQNEKGYEIILNKIIECFDDQ